MTMPGVGGEKLYGLPGAQNNAVLMDIISKLKQDLQQSRAEKNKLVDQLNVLISLVKRAWGGEQGAAMHLANIVGIPVPDFIGSEPLRNTPLPDKNRAVKNWERMAIKLLEREYVAMQQEMRDRQQQFIQNRSLYMEEVMLDHQDEMSRYRLHRHNSANNNCKVEQVDHKFMRCYSAKPSGPRRVKSAYRPSSAYQSKPKSASDIADHAEITITELLGQAPSNTDGPQQNQAVSASPGKATNSHSKLSTDHDRRPTLRRQNFDDPNRYKQTNLFDPDVIFSPETMSKDKEVKTRPYSASTSNLSQKKGVLRSRPKSAVFLTETKAERPLKYETTRPISGKAKSSDENIKGRRGSAPSNLRVKGPPTSIMRKEMHSRYRHDSQNLEFENEENRTGNNMTQGQSDHVTVDLMTSPDVKGHEQMTSEKPPISVSVTRPHSMDKFVNDLKLMDAMEKDFTKSAIGLQKKLGLDTDGFVF